MCSETSEPWYVKWCVFISRVDPPHRLLKLFSNHFSSVFSTAQVDRIPRIVNFSIISELQISSNKLHLEINSLENKGNFGPDEIPPIFIKNCMQSLEEPLLRLFNSSLSRGVFPDSWKRNFVQPIFKFGDKHDIKNYRPIAIISTIPKLFDSIVSKLLTDIVLDKIIPEQHQPPRALNCHEFNNVLYLYSRSIRIINAGRLYLYRFLESIRFC